MTVTFADAIKLWTKIGCLSFGGPAGQIALLHKEVVENRALLGEKEFLNALNFCMLLPGPEAMQLATYCGWKQHGVKGGLAAGLLFVLPGACIILALSVIYALFGNVPTVQAIFWGIKAAVLAIVFEALLKIARKALRSRLDWIIAATAFIALYVFAAPFALVVIVAGLAGFFFGTAEPSTLSSQNKPDWRATIKTIAIGLTLWLVPLLLLHFTFGFDHIQSQLARIFSTLAVVTFGGAYSVLASLGQNVVEQNGWLTTQQMMDGFGLAETTPGPLILVGQFVAFTAANTAEKSMWSALLASGVFLWMTFAPCFLWIFAGAPWIEYLETRPRLRAALSAITAAVTGVILNLSLWFGLHVIFGKVERLSPPFAIWWPDLKTFDPAALTLSIVLAFVLLRWKAGIPKTLALAALAGLSYHALRNLI